MTKTNRAAPKTAVVLSGGAGVRLRPITQDIPKGLVRIGGKPMLQWVLEWLKHNGISDVIVGVAYLKEKIMEHFGNGRKLGVSIRYSIHSVEGGTAEGFRLAISRYVDQDSFFALNGDQITDLNLTSMFQSHLRSGVVATVGTVHPRLPFGLVITDENGYCRGFLEKPVLKDITCSSGIYVFQRAILPLLPSIGDIEKTTLPALARAKRLKAYVHNGRFLTVNTVKELEEAELELEKVIKK